MHSDSESRATGTPRRLRDLMTLGSRMRYIGWRLARLKREINLTLSSGQRITLEAEPSTDVNVAYEVFVMQCYKWPLAINSRNEIKCIVDLGANVGFSVLYFAQIFPTAHIDAFEPHPAHLIRLSQIVAKNHLEERVSIHPTAAGVTQGQGLLANDFGHSTTTLGTSTFGIKIEMSDFLEFAKERRIDLLKMDIEGAEYPILMDPRFSGLNIGWIVFEWHASATVPEIDRELFRRLTDLGWLVERGPQGSYQGYAVGLAYAHRQNPVPDSR
jgi:FkbM family methyltransferase